MSSIVLATLNARYIHASVGLRYLYANLAELQQESEILEFVVAEMPRDIAERIVARDPRIVGFGVYIWNTVRTREVIAILRKIAPHITIVLGGPEVSYDHQGQEIVALADYLIVGEGEVAFRNLCRSILDGTPAPDRVISGGLPKLDELELPYKYYTDDDIRNRVIYAEVSRGCPFTCEFCLSSVDIPVRQFVYPRVLEDLDLLFQRGARTFKFVDRTFNLKIRTAVAILQFFLDRIKDGIFVHFEMIPDRFPKQLQEIVAKFPPASLQFEVGIQTFNPAVSALISRRQDYNALAENLRFLRQETGVYIHADLIAGLPGEDLESFGRGFDTLLSLNPHEIQVGILKRLRGTPIGRHDSEFRMRYSDDPPYEILQTRDLSFSDLQELGRFSRYWDLVGNSGNFISSRTLLWRDDTSPFIRFMHFSRWLFERTGSRSGITLKTLAALVFRYLTEVKGVDATEAGSAVAEDYCRGGRSDLPRELAPFRVETEQEEDGSLRIPLKRQRRSSMAGKVAESS